LKKIGQIEVNFIVVSNDCVDREETILVFQIAIV